MARLPSSHSDRVVVLNASYEVLSVVALHRAIAYVLREKAVIVAEREGASVRSASGLEFPIPRVVRLNRYIRVPYHRRVPAWTKAGLLRRDGHRCGYCGEHGNTVDHILPVSRGGQSTWQNTIVACVICNTRKGNRTPGEAQMSLRHAPSVPTVQSALLLALAATERAALADLGVLSTGSLGLVEAG